MLRFYNTISRREEEFVPVREGHAGIYACGPTIYAAPHIGNMRTFFLADVVHRYLEFRGYTVKFVMNLTDVDDKTIAGAKREGVSLGEYTEPFARILFENLDALGIERADSYPRATHFVPQMVELIGQLREKGLAYEVDGSVYFDISEFPDYGKLSKVDVTAGVRGERVAADEYEKGDVRDFALWKTAKPEDEAVGAVWETPWGRGRPGWHIECSVMSMAELGETFDIHLGGVDLIFPHHEDEIAQSEGATGKTFARYWLHGEFLLLEGDKMAKSTGNIFTVPDLLERGVTASAIRYTFLTAHYRSKLNFTFEALGAGAEAVRRMVSTHDRLRAHPQVRHPEGDDRPTLAEASSAALGNFTAAMDDDLNTSVALSAVMELVRRVNARLDGLGERPISEAEAETGLLAFRRLDSVLGILSLAERERAVDDEISATVEALIRDRQEARASKDFARADSIREELTGMGITLEDTPTGPRWSRTG